MSLNSASVRMADGFGGMGIGRNGSRKVTKALVRGERLAVGEAVGVKKRPSYNIFNNGFCVPLGGRPSKRSQTGGEGLPRPLRNRRPLPAYARERQSSARLGSLAGDACQGRVLHTS